MLSGEALQTLCSKIYDGNVSMATLITECEKCKIKYGIVAAVDETAAVVLLLKPENIKQCLAELKQLLESGITVAALANILDNTKARAQYVSFL
jgi:pyrroline-5-carboxylate reductase